MNPLVSGKLLGKDFDSEKYHAMGDAAPRGSADFIMSRSELMEFDHCAQRWIRGVEDKGDKAMEFGNLVDCLITVPNSFGKMFAVQPLEYTADKGPDKGKRKPWNNNADVCAGWKAAQGNRTIVKSDTMGEAHEAEKRLKGDARIASLLRGADKQVCVTTCYQHAGVSIGIRVLIDLVPLVSEYSDCLADLKTDRNAAPAKWTRTVFERDYHVQAAMYLDAFNSIKGVKPRTRFLHVIVENVKPFETARRMLSEEFLSMGRMRYEAALQRYCMCLKNGVWPGFDDFGGDVVNGWRLVQPEAWMIL